MNAHKRFPPTVRNQGIKGIVNSQSLQSGIIKVLTWSNWLSSNLCIPVSAEFGLELQKSIQIGLKRGQDGLTLVELSPLPCSTVRGLGRCRRGYAVRGLGSSCGRRGFCTRTAAGRRCAVGLSAYCYGRGSPQRRVKAPRGVSRLAAGSAASRRCAVLGEEG
jgi:hypothetical protein